MVEHILSMLVFNPQHQENRGLEEGRERRREGRKEGRREGGRGKKREEKEGEDDLHTEISSCGHNIYENIHH